MLKIRRALNLYLLGSFKFPFIDKGGNQKIKIKKKKKNLALEDVWTMKAVSDEFLFTFRSYYTNHCPIYPMVGVS